MITNRDGMSGENWEIESDIDTLLCIKLISFIDN